MKMMIRKRSINDIPILEVVPKDLANQALPLIILYHGWRNRKELMLTHGRKLAAHGFRVILPDAMHHGERKSVKISSIPSMTFWSSIQYNIAEFTTILNYFAKHDWLLERQIGVGGYSMGGITTAALLSNHPEIKVAASIMGTPAPAAYVKLMFQTVTERGGTFSKDLPLVLSWIPQFDLSLKPETIAGRPVLFWHGTEDPKIPYQQVADFESQIKNEAFAEQTIFLTGQEEGHLVTIDLMDEVTDFFAKHL
ncbi:alpha/beta fold hydrolase [Isobaculum melis]|uniref:Peptidase S9 prolyl oligopeptidase catalytic domain-containing protein n=1 Tax=Isobaculum melis TaxID=142588 RepID=A0A1H9PNW5_9LACT|nr:alpha/beta fold hydrolase [Isobaculum melis]SER49868.1 hypothetical protein SAMN04488559_10142 [Isobaculum melis]